MEEDIVFEMGGEERSAVVFMRNDHPRYLRPKKCRQTYVLIIVAFTKKYQERNFGENVS